MKYFCQILIFFFSFIIFTGISWSKCDFSYYDSANQELDIPCIDIGIGTCVHAVLELDLLDSDDNKIVFHIKDVTNTHNPLPTNEDAVFDSIYDGSNESITIPYVMIDTDLDLGTYKVSLKLDTNKNDVDISKWRLTVDSLEKSEIPNICEKQNIKSCRSIDEDGSLIYCVEYTGDASFVNAMMCGNTESAYAACPAGAISSCDRVLFGTNHMIDYAYIPEAITPAMISCDNYFGKDFSK